MFILFSPQTKIEANSVQIIEISYNKYISSQLKNEDAFPYLLLLAVVQTLERFHNTKT